MADAVVEALTARLGAAAVTSGEAINPDDCHDESLHAAGTVPRAVVRPRSTADVVAVVEVCREHGTPIVPRGSGTGLSGPRPRAPTASSWRSTPWRRSSRSTPRTRSPSSALG